MQINFPKEVIVTDQRVDISDFSDAEKNFVRNVTEGIMRKYRKSKEVRQVVGITGPSGAGKSLLSVLVKTIAKELHAHISIHPRAVLISFVGLRCA